jgi:hypothetical protein
MRSALSGMLAAFAVVAALYLFRFARRTGDRFFDYFAVAFALLSVNSFLLAITDSGSEGHVAVYLVRLLAFGTIVAAIFAKNRE